MKVIILNSKNAVASVKQGKKRKRDDGSKGSIEGSSSLIDFSSDNGMNSLRVLGTLFGSEEKATEFKQKYFLSHGQIPVVVRGSEKRVALLTSQLFELDIAQLLENSASDEIQVWLGSQKQPADNHSREISGAIKVSDPAQAHALYKAGHSLYCRAPGELEEATVKPLMNELGFGLNSDANPATDRFSRGEVEMFYSRAGHLTDTHTDFQENFTVQLSGIKKWTFRRSPVDAPLRGYTPHFGKAQGQDVKETQLKAAGACIPQMKRSTASSTLTGLQSADKKAAANANDASEEYCSVILHPGDVLYHPAGVFHKVECIEDSIAINISLYAASAAEVFCSALQQYLWQSGSQSRQPFLRDGSGLASESAKAAIADMKRLCKSFCDQVEVGDILPLPCLEENINTPRKYHEEEGSNNESSQESDSDEEEESDGEERDDESRVIDVLDFVMRNIADSSPIAHKEGNSFRLNPLAHLILPEDLQAMGSDVSPDGSKSYVVHVGYGNESLESVCRRVVRFPARNKSTEDIMGGAKKAKYIYQAEDLVRNVWLEGKYAKAPAALGVTDRSDFVSNAVFWALESAGLLTSTDKAA
jgi:ribosomal protein L16 Arg81 hydroxylase